MITQVTRMFFKIAITMTKRILYIYLGAVNLLIPLIYCDYKCQKLGKCIYPLIYS